jgi:hypothetical protein
MKIDEKKYPLCYSVAKYYGIKTMGKFRTFISLCEPNAKLVNSAIGFTRVHKLMREIGATMPGNRK